MSKVNIYNHVVLHYLYVFLAAVCMCKCSTLFYSFVQVFKINMPCTVIFFPKIVIIKVLRLSIGTL